MTTEKDNQEKTTKPIIYVDASSLKGSSCQRRLIYNNFYGFTTKNWAHNYQAGYGLAVHRALEFFYGSETKSTEIEKQAIQIASDFYKPYTPWISQKEYEFRTPTHLVKTLEAYFKNYNQDAETLTPIKGVLTPGLLETKFTYPATLLRDNFYSPYFDIIIAGTIDMIASHYGQECFVDHKSTSTKWGEKDKYFAEYDLSVQMEMYSFIMKRLTGNLFPFMINGIFLKKTTKEAEKKRLFDGVNFERYGPRTYTEGQLAEFETWLVGKLEALHEWLEYYFMNQDHGSMNDPSKITTPEFSACHPKWGCPYIKVCSQDPDIQGRILGLMEREQYNPLHFSD